MRESVIRAIDVGYGNTKYIKATNNGQAVAAYFPSIVHIASGAKSSMSRMQENPHVYSVEVKGTTFEVGPGIDSALEGTARVLHDNYIETDQYTALMYGALSQMDEDEIDLLVVGLPVDLMASKREMLEAKFTGEHIISGRNVFIKKVNAVAQPLGGFLQYTTMKNDLDNLNRYRSLLIDPGFFTVDFLVTTGLREIKGKSGSHPTGVSAYLKAIAKGISKDHGINYENLSHIDEGLRTGEFRLYGRAVDLAKYHNNAVSEIMPAVEEIANKVGDGRSIDRIVLVGGGANLFKKPLQAVFPNHTIEHDNHSVVANVLGFQRIGEAWYASQRQSEAARVAV